MGLRSKLKKIISKAPGASTVQKVLGKDPIARTAMRYDPLARQIASDHGLLPGGGQSPEAMPAEDGPTGFRPPVRSGTSWQAERIAALRARLGRPAGPVAQPGTPAAPGAPAAPGPSAGPAAPATGPTPAMPTAPNASAPQAVKPPSLLAPPSQGGAIAIGRPAPMLPGGPSAAQPPKQSRLMTSPASLSNQGGVSPNLVMVGRPAPMVPGVRPMPVDPTAVDVDAYSKAW